jgi:hypothetical protein
MHAGPVSPVSIDTDTDTDIKIPELYTRLR